MVSVAGGVCVSRCAARSSIARNVRLGIYHQVGSSLSRTRLLMAYARAVTRRIIRDQPIASEIDFGKKGRFWTCLNLIFKISCFCLYFLSSGKEGYWARILDIILASFGGGCSHDFLRHFSCVFMALLKRLIFSDFCAQEMTDYLRWFRNFDSAKKHIKTLLKKVSKLCLKWHEKTRP